MSDIQRGDEVLVRISQESGTQMRGRVYAVLNSGLVIILVGNNLYDAEPKNVQLVPKDEQV
jgi:hypothetical protein